jgi:precorrin-6A/cobalt-precorrin-6A reductase
VVSADAIRAYAPHPRLIGRVGALAGPAAISGELLTPEGRARFRWVIDASHPFARRISADLAEVCTILRQPLLRLERPAFSDVAGARITLLEDLDALQALDLGADRLLLAIGARHLAHGVARSGAAACFARILPTPSSLRLALGAGLGSEALACHRPGTGLDPGDSGAIERALLRRWSITAVLCRQSGGATEAIWRNLCGEMGLWLLLLRRPREPLEGLACPLDVLLTRVGRPVP